MTDPLVMHTQTMRGKVAPEARPPATGCSGSRWRHGPNRQEDDRPEYQIHAPNRLLTSLRKPDLRGRSWMAGLRPSAPVPRSAGGQVAQSRASRTIDQWDVALASSTGESRACLLPLVPLLWQQDSSGLRRARPPTSHGSRSWSGLFLSSRRHVNFRMASSRGEVGQFYAAE